MAVMRRPEEPTLFIDRRHFMKKWIMLAILAQTVVLIRIYDNQLDNMKK